MMFKQLLNKYLLKFVSVMRRFAAYPCRFLPLQNKVVFVNFFGRGFGDDPKYILLEMLKRGVDTELIWLSNNIDEIVPSGVKVVKYKSFKAHYHWYTARVWVDNCKGSYRPDKRKKQFYLQTWHASVPLKQVEQAVEKSLDVRYVSQAKKESSTIDLMYSNNDIQIDVDKHSFWYNGPVVKCDVPREVPLLRDRSMVKEQIYRYYSINTSVKIVLYAPTFRTNTNLEIFQWDYQLAVNALEEKYNSEFVMLVRLHPNIARLCKGLSCGKKVINATDYPDMQELLAVSDVMINDYSSTQFDFIMMKKPVFLMCPDIVNYRKNDRPWVFEPEELPYSISLNVKELVDNIKKFDFEKYEKTVDLFLQKIGFEDHGNGDKIVADIIMEQLKG